MYPQNFIAPMKAMGFLARLDAKTLLNGVMLPPRTPSSPDIGTATLLDINAAMDCLFNHPNVGPFIGRQLIEKLVTSNPSPAYVGRVAAAFADNGQGVRGNMKAVIKAILLDAEARDPARMSDPTFGKLREPFLRCVNLAHAFNATAPGGLLRARHFLPGPCRGADALAQRLQFLLPQLQSAGTCSIRRDCLRRSSKSSTRGLQFPRLITSTMRWRITTSIGGVRACQRKPSV